MGAVSLPDVRVRQARRLHREAAQLTKESEAIRAKRNKLIREVYAGGGWSYSQLAEKIGCSQELIAHTVKGGK